MLKNVTNSLRHHIVLTTAVCEVSISNDQIFESISDNKYILCN